MCINIFYPLIHEEKLDLLVSLLGFPGEKVNYDYSRFEKVSDVEKVQDTKIEYVINDRGKTNFDFFIKLQSGIEIYFEIKYSEDNFRSASNDDSHKWKFKYVYEKFLGNLLFISEETKTKASDVTLFLKHYQLYRNLVHLGDQRYVIFIYPDKNEKLSHYIHNAMGTMVGDDWRSKCDLKVNHCEFVTWEKIIGQIIDPFGDDPLASYYREDFYEKYMNIDDIES